MGPGNDFCCEGDRITGSCGGQIGCPTEECEHYVAIDMCPEAYPFMNAVGSNTGRVTSGCCKTAAFISCNQGTVTCMKDFKDADGPCKSYDADGPSSDGKNLQYLKKVL